jgi:aspartate carbamoyltransferase catalytic subunit
MKDVISIKDFSREEILAVLDAAEDVERAIHEPGFSSKFEKKYGRKLEDLLAGELIATTFVENSSRTYHSFRAAALKSGAKIDGFPTEDYTSLKKGETWTDTMAMIAGYGAGGIVMRTKIEGVPRLTKEFLQRNHEHLSRQHARLGLPYSYKVPKVFNGGDGTHEHPTQFLLDAYLMRKLARAEGKDLDGLSIALTNDLAHSRVQGSHINGAVLFNWTLHFAHPDRFGPKQHQIEELVRHGVKFHDHGENFKEAMRNSFITCHSRPQKERVGQGEDLAHVKRVGQINLAVYEDLGIQAPALMHPLPVDSEDFEEIAYDLMFHEKNFTKMQAMGGLYVRIALMALGLGKMILPIEYGNREKEERKYTIETLPISEREKHLENPRTGFISQEGVVIDHIPKGKARRLLGILGMEGKGIPLVCAEYVPPLEGSETKDPKDMIKIHCQYDFSNEQMEALSLFEPTISYISGGRVMKKKRPRLGSVIEGMIQCGNPNCVTNVKKEHLTTKHRVQEVSGTSVFSCNYCEVEDTLEKVYKDNRFVYLK